GSTPVGRAIETLTELTPTLPPAGQRLARAAAIASGHRAPSRPPSPCLDTGRGSRRQVHATTSARRDRAEARCRRPPSSRTTAASIRGAWLLRGPRLSRPPLHRCAAATAG